MIIIFDLDYTLLDTKELNIQTAQALGLDLEKYYQSRQKYFSEKTNYNAYKHIRALIKAGKIEREESENARKRIIKMLNNINSLLYPDAEPILQKFKKQGHNLIMLTFGDPVWQGLKIKDLKIKKYFSRVIITDKTKSDVLDFLQKEKDRIIFINDNARESIGIKKAIPQADIILIDGSYTRNVKHDFKIHQLKDCLDIIK